MEWISQSLFLVEVGGIGRSAGAALLQVQAHVQENTSATQATKDLADLAVQGFHQIQTSGIATLSSLLNEAWRLKQIASPNILMSAGNAVMELGMSNGASAGKLLGAGGGGFVLFVVEPAERARFLASMRDKKLLNIQPDLAGVSVVYEEEGK
jgi:D-glycero-alpha-D-manno-heptose-7-phosphate kinase